MAETTLTIRGIANAAETAKQIRIEANRLDKAFPHMTPDAPIVALIRDLRIVANALRDAAEHEAYESRAAKVMGLAGERIRITWPNGAQRTGIAGSRIVGYRGETEGRPVIPTLDGSLLTGELTPCTRIERMVGRRYETVIDYGRKGSA